jgi:hypothetical protein
VRLDITLILYWGSLAISAAAVVLFLWLMREGRETENGKRKTKS